jgi:hypothetical protein
MPQFAERVRVNQRRPEAISRRPRTAELQPPRTMAHPPARIGAPVTARVASPIAEAVAARRREGEPTTRTGLPPRLRTGIEALSGLAMDDVRVHRNSAEPARLGALAFTRGGEIHLGPGQEQHLPHEAWHVVQQKQGRVKATAQMKGAAISADPALEAEADQASDRLANGVVQRSPVPLKSVHRAAQVVQRQVRKKKPATKPAAQLGPTQAPVWNIMRDPGAVEPNPFIDELLGLRIVDPAEIEKRIRRIVTLPSGGMSAKAKADFDKSPALARAQLEHSHWPSDEKRLLYARFYFEQFLSAGGDRVDNETLVRALVSFEVRVQSQTADLVVHNPITDLDRSRLASLRKPRMAEAIKWGQFESPFLSARAEFFSNQSSSWNSRELEKLAHAVELASLDYTSLLPLKFFQYYSDHVLKKMSGDEERDSKKKDVYALTDPGKSTRLRTDVIDFPEEKLGPILLHELGHTQDAQNWMGLGAFQEGHGYAIEYFFSKSAERKATILDILNSDSLVVANKKPDLISLYKNTLATLMALNEVIQTGSSPHLPTQLLPADSKARETAKQLMAERVELSEPRSKLLIAITKYVRAHIGEFDIFGV